MEGKETLTAQAITTALVSTTVVVGTMLDGKPNWMTIAWAVPAVFSPPCVVICANKRHVTNRGIKETKAFSINIPTKSQIVPVDFVGIKSGAEEDKSKVFATVPGRVTGTPLALECPIVAECSLLSVTDCDAAELFVGKIEGIFASNSCLTDGKVDMAKLQPCLFSFSGKDGPGYYDLGPQFSVPWSAGLEYKTASAEKTPGTEKKPYPHVDTEACVGCATCVTACARGLFVISESGKAFFRAEEMDDCARCGHCVQNCPANAIELKL